MGYGFHFESPGLTYYEICEEEEGIRSKLETLAKNYCRNGNVCVGEVLFFEAGERNILSAYEYSFKDGELITEELN
tara:strand:- start:387 stop:614 length:228 start_codon:yes stop_codon:yes gene_type:complete